MNASPGGALPPPSRPPVVHALLVLLVAGAVYLPRLGATGLSNTEGHRAIPGWAMLDSGDWLLPRLFEQAYLRKPLGMPWAVAASSSIFGQTEFAARLPSALAMIALSLTALWFGARWFGARHGLAAGLLTALTPLFWQSGRSAEIEALNNFATGAAVLLLLDLCLGPARRGIASMALAGLAVALAAVAKGPAGFAAIGAAAVVGMTLGSRNGQGVPRGTPPRGRVVRLAVPFFVAAAILVPLYFAVENAAAGSGQGVVRQGVSEFLWGTDRLSIRGLGGVLCMAPLALLTALPASLVLLFPWGPDARAEAAGDKPRMPGSALLMARAVAWTCLLSLAILTVLGVHNPRYAMPSLAFVPVLASYVHLGLDGGFTPLRARIARALMLGRPWILGGALLIATGVFAWVIEPRQRSTSGREAGMALAASIPDGAVVWADHMIEARPELLHYARLAAASEGRALRPVWVTNLARALAMPREDRTLLLLRTDAGSGEAAAYEAAGLMDRLRPVAGGRIHKFEYTLHEKRQEP